jgi:hypothetical protein
LVGVDKLGLLCYIRGDLDWSVLVKDDELRKLAKELGLADDHTVIMSKPIPWQPEVVMEVRRRPAEPPTQYGEFTWWKCRRCKHYYNAPKKMSMCTLCQHKSLRVGG